MSDVTQAIREIGKSNEEVYSAICTVKDVDENARTCTVVPVDGRAIVHKVRLQSALGKNLGFLAIPKVGSSVIVTFINRNTAYVGVAEELEKVLAYAPIVELGGEDGQPIPLGEDLNSNLKKLNDNLRSLINRLNQFANTQAGLATGDAAPLAAGFTTLASSLAPILTALSTWDNAINGHLSTISKTT